jgi:hypothetical protein
MGEKRRTIICERRKDERLALQRDRRERKQSIVEYSGVPHSQRARQKAKCQSSII